MEIKNYTTTEKLEKYSFNWSILRLVLGSAALFLGGVPPVLIVNPIPSLYGVLSSLLHVAWIISGLASVYLLYRWSLSKKVFGSAEKIDVYTFFIMIVTGFNLGITGLLGKNIGMAITTNRTVFFIVGVIYLACAYRLFTKSIKNGGKLF